MKKIFFMLGLLINSIISVAQNELPKEAKEVSPLLIGEKIPSIELLSENGETIKSTAIIAQKKTILVIYRGGWCPYCNAHLTALGESEKELLDLGYQIVAISPDSPKNLQKAKSGEKINYRLYSDSNGNFSKGLGIAFQAPENYKPYIGKGSEGVNTSFLPVPSIFILDTKGEILFEYIAPDFKHRISNELLIAAAKSVNNL